MIFLENQKGLHLQSQDSLPDAREAINDFWSVSGNFIYRHHIEPRVKLHSPREESFTIPLKYIDVSRTAHTNLDVKKERRIDDYWNIDGSRDLSDSWTGFTQFTLFEEKPPDGYMWSGERLTRKQLTSRPDYLWPELWEKMGKNAKLKVRQKWSENYEEFISLTLRIRNSKKTTKNARKKLETPVTPAMPCKISQNNQNWATDGKSNKIKSKLACILEASESTRLRMGESLCRKRRQFIAASQFGSQIYSYASSNKNSSSKSSSGQGMGKLEKISAWNLTKVISKKDVIDEARTKGVKVHFASLMDICHLKNAELETKHQKYKGRVVLRGLMQYSQSKDHQHHK